MKPIKRAPELQDWSREHHHTLLLCWKIKTGLAKSIPFQRIKVYADWYYQTYLLPHFETEENNLLPILGAHHPYFQQTLDEHRELRKLFEQKSNLENTLKELSLLLEKHVRFEERELFNSIQETASPYQLAQLASTHQVIPFVDNESDPFWLNR